MVNVMLVGLIHRPKAYRIKMGHINAYAKNILLY